MKTELHAAERQPIDATQSISASGVVTISATGTFRITNVRDDGGLGTTFFYETLEDIPQPYKNKIKELLWMPVGSRVNNVGYRVSDKFFWLYKSIGE